MGSAGSACGEGAEADAFHYSARILAPALAAPDSQATVPEAGSWLPQSHCSQSWLLGYGELLGCLGRT